MRRIALVFQNAEMQVVSQSVEKDIAFGPENMGLDKAEIARRVDNALSLMDLKDKARQRPQTLSGGELRKCAIAGIIAMEPDVILLDEPFAGIDPKAVYEIKQIIKELSRRGIGILLTDHNVRDALSITTCAHIINEGEILISGTSEELINNETAQEIYFGHDFARGLGL